MYNIAFKCTWKKLLWLLYTWFLRGTCTHGKDEVDEDWCSCILFFQRCSSVIRKTVVNLNPGAINFFFFFFFSFSSSFPHQDTNKTQKYIKKEGASEANHKVQENRSIVHSSGLSFQHGKCMRDSSLIQGECRLSDGSLSPDRPYGETSLSVPLHPTKRPASNPPPISNQATKGTAHLCCPFARERRQGKG